MNTDIQTFRKTAGTIDEGKDYEYSLIAFLCLQLANNEEVQNFQLSSNDKEYDKFDDVVVEISYKTGNTERFAIQTKHVDNDKRRISLNHLADKTGDFSIQKYYESFKKLGAPENVNFVLYTNRILENEQFQISLKSKEHLKLIAKCHSSEQTDLLQTSKGNLCVVKFEIDGNDELEISTFKKFLEKFSLYVNQHNLETMTANTLALFKKFYNCDEMGMFTSFIKNWAKSKTFYEKLNKRVIELKIAEILLTPLIEVVPLADADEKSKLLSETVRRFDVTVVQNCEKFVNFLSNDADISRINETGLRFGVVSKKARNIEELDAKMKTKIFWHMGTIPLVIRVDGACTVVQRALQLCRNERKLVLLGGKFDRGQFAGMKMFTSLEDLDEDEEILEKFTVSLQGRSAITLKKLLEIDNGMKTAITPDVLLNMLNQDLCIGNKLEELPEYYISRCLQRVLIDFDFIKTATGDLSIISCDGKLGKIRSFFKGKRWIKLDEYFNGKDMADYYKRFWNKCILYSDRKCSEKEFTKFCEDNPNRVCHHFQITKKKNLEWLKSNGSIKKLTDYMQLSRDYFQESEIFDVMHNKFCIISAEAGMGKTVMVTYFKNNCPPNFWAIGLNFREHFLYLTEEHAVEDILNYIFEFESKKNKYSSVELDVRNGFRNKKKIVLLWDALDELPQSSLEPAINVLKRISMIGFLQIITTRSYLKRFLEDQLDVFALNIKEIDEEQQRRYVKDRLKGKKELKEIVPKIIRNVASTQDRNFLGVPLQLYMLTDLFIKDSSKYLNLLENIFSVTDLYHHFFEETLHFTFAKTNYDPTNSIARLVYKHSKDYQLLQYQLLALKTHLREEIFQDCHNVILEDFLEEVKTEGDCLGMISIDQNGTPSFAHNTFGEFFVAFWLSKNFKLVQNLKTFLFEMKNTNIRLMFDMILAQNRPAHLAVLYKSIETLRKYKNEISKKDRCGRSPLHLASSWGERHNLLNTRRSGGKYQVDINQQHLMKEDSREYKDILNFLILEESCDVFEKDNLFQWNCIEYADSTLSLLPLEIISKNHGDFLEKLPNFKDVCSVLFYAVKFNFMNLFNSMDRLPYFEDHANHSNLLHVAAFFDRPQFLSKLLAEGQYKRNINRKCLLNGIINLKIPKIETSSYCITLSLEVVVDDTIEASPLDVAALEGHLQIVNVLLEMNARIDEQNSKGMAALHWAALRGHLEVVRTLIDKGANIDICNDFNSTPLHLAAFFEHLDVVKLLLAKGAPIEEDENGLVAIDYAAIFGNLEIVKTFDKRRNAEDLRLSVLLATKFGQLNVVKFLINEKNVDVNFNDKGDTLLHIAAANGHIHVIDFLIRKGAQLNSQTNLKNCTPLHVAVERNQMEVVKILCKAGADTNIVDRHERTPLSLAQYHKHFYISQFLMQWGGTT